MSDVFCKIVKGEAEAVVVWEDEKHLAILDQYPNAPGHTLVIPKKHVRYFTDMHRGDFLELMDAAFSVSEKLKAAAGVERILLKLVGAHVPHVHVHLVPERFEGVVDKKAFKKIGEKIRQSEQT